MSDLRLASFVLGSTMASLASLAPLHAQTVDEIRARLDTLVAEWRAEVQAETARAERLRAGVDTVRTGQLVILTRPEHRAFVEESARMAWNVMEKALAGDADLGFHLTYYVEPRGEPDRGAWVFAGRVQVISYERSEGPDLLARLLVDDVESRLAPRMDSTRTFLGRLSVEPLSKALREHVYVELATAPSPAARSCLEGSSAACSLALGLQKVPDPVTAWYAPEERRFLVRSRLWPRNRDRAEVVRGCVEERSDEACLSLLRSLPARSLRPLGGDARDMLAHTAVELGGEGAWGRLLAPGPAGPVERLDSAARIGLDSLVMAWRAEVLAARPRTMTLGALTGWSTLGWILVLTFFAARSRRWRAG